MGAHNHDWADETVSICQYMRVGLVEGDLPVAFGAVGRHHLGFPAKAEPGGGRILAAEGDEAAGGVSPQGPGLGGLHLAGGQEVRARTQVQELRHEA